MTEPAAAARTKAADLSEGYSAGAALEAKSRHAVLNMRRMRRWINVILLALADVIAFGLAALLFRTSNPVPVLTFAHQFGQASVNIDVFYILGAAFIFIRYLVGDYSRRQLFWDGIRQTTIAVIVTSVPAFLIVLIADVPYSLLTTALSWTFLLFAIPLVRQLSRWLMAKASIWQLPTVLVGDGPNAIEAFEAFNDSLSLGFSVRFLVGLGDQPESPSTIGDVTRMPLRDPENIVRRLTSEGCLEAVLAIEGKYDDEIEDLIQRFMAAGLGVAIIPPLRRLPLLGMTMNYFFGRDLLLLQVQNNLGRLPGQVFKRCVDIVGSIVLLIVSSPLFLFVIIRIWLDDGQPALFSQRRIGQHGREFNCIKFRTMRLDAEDQLARWKRENSPYYAEYVASNFKLPNDPRVTRVGRMLRRTSLDELPQLINVLVGDMSLVGPRPLLAREIPDYGPSFKLYRLLRPGITGLWQINGRSSTTFANRVASDEWYIKNWSFWYDVVILLKTARVLVQQKGAY